MFDLYKFNNLFSAIEITECWHIAADMNVSNETKRDSPKTGTNKPVEFDWNSLEYDAFEQYLLEHLGGRRRKKSIIERRNARPKECMHACMLCFLVEGLSYLFIHFYFFDIQIYIYFMNFPLDQRFHHMYAVRFCIHDLNGNVYDWEYGAMMPTGVCMCMCIFSEIFATLMLSLSILPPLAYIHCPFTGYEFTLSEQTENTHSHKCSCTAQNETKSSYTIYMHINMRIMYSLYKYIYVLFKSCCGGTHNSAGWISCTGCRWWQRGPRRLVVVPFLSVKTIRINFGVLNSYQMYE